MISPMRFAPNGPLIPGDLLISRDEGKVVFFCGAGVSTAYAKLPSFYRLTRKVCEFLGLSSNDFIYKTLEEIPKFEHKIGTTGLVPMDKIFGLLEQQFDTNNIERAIVKALNYSNPDLTAHEILLQLSKTKEGKIQLVTTNFDRLFSNANPGAANWVAPNLPDIKTNKEIDGIIYLHGRINDKYTHSETGLILTSAKFGDAYLNNGWATEFIKNILNNYIIVFIGYSADDPPISYLLESLKENSTNAKNLYAFQPGENELDLNKWRQKGVIPISYNKKNNHILLWETLKHWANRAENIDDWYNNVVSYVNISPIKLKPYQRGQVAHIVSSIYGARKFAECQIIPSPEWLLVFDAYCRYGIQNINNLFQCSEKYRNVFDIYCLDSDIKMPSQGRGISTLEWIDTYAWDAFKINEIDLLEINNKNIANIKNFYNINQDQLELVTRHKVLAKWLVKISDDPITIWWASKQKSFNNKLIQLIKWELPKFTTSYAKYAYKCWDYLTEVWRNNKYTYDMEWECLRSYINLSGWDANNIKKFGDIFKPTFVRLTVKK